MEDKIIKKWEENKDKLRYFFQNTKQREYDSYAKILEAICENILLYKEPNVLESPLGRYSGDSVFVLTDKALDCGYLGLSYNSDTCCNESFIITTNDYGSCSGCDTLLSISKRNTEFPSEEQVNEYMTLSLHLVQRMFFCPFIDEEENQKVQVIQK